MKNKFIGIIMLVFIAFFMAPFAKADEYNYKDDLKGASKIEKRLIKAIEKAKMSVVRINTVTKGGGRGIGSGVILKENGYILTNSHVLRNASRITVALFNGKKFHATIVGKSVRTDLAVIKINALGLLAPRWGNSKKLRIGQTAIAIGNPYKFTGSVSMGIISAINRRIPAAGIIYKELIQTDAAINPGNSGGALIDSRGMVIGINTLVYSGSGGLAAQGLGFAIPIHRALIISKKIMSKNIYYEPKPWIGINGVNVTRQMAESNMLPVNTGVLITYIHPVSPSERAGLRKGDIVTEADGGAIKNIEDFKQALHVKKPGEDMVLRIWREAKVKSMVIKVSQRSIPP